MISSFKATRGCGRTYSNLGRFSAHYRAKLDEMPSRTLQRSQESASR